MVAEVSLRGIKWLLKYPKQEGIVHEDCIHKWIGLVTPNAGS